MDLWERCDCSWDVLASAPPRGFTAIHCALTIPRYLSPLLARRTFTFFNNSQLTSKYLVDDRRMTVNPNMPSTFPQSKLITSIVLNLELTLFSSSIFTSLSPSRRNTNTNLRTPPHHRDRRHRTPAHRRPILHIASCRLDEEIPVLPTPGHSPML
jgi:hypothetical protein